MSQLQLMIELGRLSPKTILEAAEMDIQLAREAGAGAVFDAVAEALGDEPLPSGDDSDVEDIAIEAAARATCRAVRPAATSRGWSAKPFAAAGVAVGSKS